MPLTFTAQLGLTAAVPALCAQTTQKHRSGFAHIEYLPPPCCAASGPHTMVSLFSTHVSCQCPFQPARSASLGPQWYPPSPCLDLFWSITWNATPPLVSVPQKVKAISSTPVNRPPCERPLRTCPRSLSMAMVLSLTSLTGAWISWLWHYIFYFSCVAYVPNQNLQLVLKLCSESKTSSSWIAIIRCPFIRSRLLAPSLAEAKNQRSDHPADARVQ